MKADYLKFMEMIFDGANDSYSKEYFETLSKELEKVSEDNLR